MYWKWQEAYESFYDRKIKLVIVMNGHELCSFDRWMTWSYVLIISKFFPFLWVFVMSISLSLLLRVTLDEGPRSRDQWFQAILLVKSFKLVPRPLDEGARPKKWQMDKPYVAPVLEGKSIDWDQKTVLKGELLIWRPKNQARDEGTVQLKDSICFKSVQIGS